MQNLKPILLVEDDSVDAMTVKRSLKELNVANGLVCTTNGEEALQYLENENNTKPGVILLDLNMPKMNGLEFLRVVKDNELLRKIPIVVLTTSKEERDVVESFELSVAGYMVKPVDYKKFVEIIRAIDMYWTLSRLPVVN